MYRLGRAVLIICMVLCGMCAAAYAAEETEWTAGIKAWYNKWTQEVPDPTFGGKSSSSWVTLVGPTIEARFPNKLYLEASYLLSTSDYKLNSPTGSDAYTADRKDLEAAVGYRFAPEVGIFAGYKSVNSDYEGTTAGAGSGRYDLAGPFIGLRGDVPVGKTFTLYAIAMYLDTKLKVTNPSSNFSSNEDCPGTIFELGIKAAFSKQVSAALGYRIESTKEDKSNTEDAYAGATLGLMYSF